MVLNQTSENFRKLFLLLFTKELLLTSMPKDLIIKKPEVNKLKKEVIDIIKKEEIKRPFEKKDLKFQIKNAFNKKPLMRKKPRFLKIPNQKLPKRLQYLKPTPTKLQIDLGVKLNPLIKDPAVKDIECYGPNTNLIVKGIMGTKNTNILLTKEEIDSIIKKFEEVSKIPSQEGIYKVTKGKFIFSAIISKITGSKFILKKMSYNPNFN